MSFWSARGVRAAAGRRRRLTGRAPSGTRVRASFRILASLLRTTTGMRRSGRPGPGAMAVSGDRIRQAREIAGLTQAELAADVGVNQSTITRLESNLFDRPEEPRIEA